MSEQAIAGLMYLSTLWVVLMYIALCVVAGAILATKNRDGYLAFLVSLLFTPLPFLLYALGAAPKRKRVKG